VLMPWPDRLWLWDGTVERTKTCKVIPERRPRFQYFRPIVFVELWRDRVNPQFKWILFYTRSLVIFKEQNLNKRMQNWLSDSWKLIIDSNEKYEPGGREVEAVEPQSSTCPRSATPPPSNKSNFLCLSSSICFADVRVVYIKDKMSLQN